MAARKLLPGELATHCDAAALQIDRDAGPAPPDIVGQDRARAAVEFGIAMRHAGYHLYVMGSPGSGKRSLVRRAIDAHVAADGIHRSDWVYVNNFETPHRPKALQLAAGRGAQLRADMRALVQELRSTIPAAFESEEYAAELERLNTDFKERAERGLLDVSAEAQKQGLLMIRTPVGFTFAPQKGSEVMSPQDFEALPQAERERLQKAVQTLQDKLVQVLRESMRLRKEHADRLRSLNRSTTQLAVDHAVDETKARYAELAEVAAYLEAVRAAVIDNADAFRTREDADANAAAAQAAELGRYEVNLLVDAGGSDGAPVVDADLPSYQNLVGRVDHVAHFGMLVTDFRHIKAGLLHRANGGYLLVDAVKLLTQPFAWNALKRALLAHEIRIESMAEMFSMVSTIQLEPQPIPLELKVVLVGERSLCHALQAWDPEFDKLFRVIADLGDDLPREAGTQQALARTLARQMHCAGLLSPTAAALARLIDHGARCSGDATRISANIRRLLDVAHEADHLARAAQRTQLDADDIAAAIAARRERAGRVDERMRQAMLRDILAIATQGAGRRPDQRPGGLRRGWRDLRRAVAHHRHHAAGRRPGGRHPARDTHGRAGACQGRADPVVLPGGALLALPATRHHRQPGVRADLRPGRRRQRLAGRVAGAAEFDRRRAAAPEPGGHRFGRPVRHGAGRRRGEREDRRLLRPVRRTRPGRHAGRSAAAQQCRDADAA